MSDLTRAMLDDIRPKGDIWTPEEQAGLDLLLEGMADNYEVVRTFLSTLSDIRNPLRTPVLSDLEREYGVTTDLSLSEVSRRLRLASVAFSLDGNGSIPVPGEVWESGDDDIQTALVDAGFDVQVHSNDPAVDPMLFLDGTFQMVAGGDTGFAGNEGAFISQTVGELLVNGAVISTEKTFDSLSGAMFSGDGFSGSFVTTQLSEKIYTVPADSSTWPMIFFVGGDATRDPGTGALTVIEFVEVDAAREAEFKSLILKYMPMHAWAALIVFYA